MSTKTKVWLIIIPAIFAYITFFTWFAAFFFGIKSVEDLPPMTWTWVWSHWMFLVYALLSFSGSVGLAIYALILVYRESAKYQRDLKAKQDKTELLKKDHAAELGRLEVQHKSEIFNAFQIRDIAVDELRAAKAETEKIKRELEETKKCYYCPPGDLPVSLQPTSGPGTTQFLLVTNHGRRQAFRAQCIVRGRSREEIKASYDMTWDSGHSTKEISAGEKGQLRVARAWDDPYRNYLALVRGQWTDVEELFWGRDDRNPGFSFEIEVRILADDPGVHVEEFIVKPGKSAAIEIIKVQK